MPGVSFVILLFSSSYFLSKRLNIRLSSSDCRSRILSSFLAISALAVRYKVEIFAFSMLLAFINSATFFSASFSLWVLGSVSIFVRAKRWKILLQSYLYWFATYTSDSSGRTTKNFRADSSKVQKHAVFSVRVRWLPRRSLFAECFLIIFIFEYLFDSLIHMI